MNFDAVRQSEEMPGAVAEPDLVRDEFIPFLENYENALRGGDVRTPAQWLLENERLPNEILASLSKLYWLYCNGKRGPVSSSQSPAALPRIPGYEILIGLSQLSRGPDMALRAASTRNSSPARRRISEPITATWLSS